MDPSYHYLFLVQWGVTSCWSAAWTGTAGPAVRAAPGASSPASPGSAARTPATLTHDDYEDH